MSAVPGSKLPAPLRAPWKAWRARWHALGERDRALASLALAVIGLFVLWSLAIQPAWRTLRDGPAQRDALDAQWQSMQALAAEAQQLRQTPALGAEAAAAALRAATERLGGTARLVLQGERAVLTLTGVGPGALRDWLAEAQSGARARPVEAQLTRGPAGFSGSITLQLGAGA